MAKARGEAGRLDEAARAGWLYYVAGNTQDQIAAKLGVSRQTAQRLVSLSVSAGLVRVRLDHPIAACLELADRLRTRYRLTLVEVVPTDPASPSTVLGVAEACAAEMERRLVQAEPIVLAVGTGRTLKAAVENLPKMSCPQHRVVSLTGNISSDGSASVYNVVYVMADTLQEARHFPMPLPVVVSSPAERELLHDQKVVQNTLSLVKTAQVTFVGIGELGLAAPLLADGFISRDDVAHLEAAGAVGEIVGWAFGRDGQLIDCAHNQRVASAPIPATDRSEVIAVAMGQAKLAAIRAAVTGHLVNGLITDEATAAALLASPA